MTTYTKSALHIVNAFDAGAGGFEPVDAFTAFISFSVPDEVTGLPYTVLGDSGQELFIDFSTIAGASLSSSASLVGTLDAVDTDFLTSVTTDTGTFTALGLEQDIAGGQRILVATSLGGIEIPTINSLADFQAFESTFGLETSSLAHDPGPGDSINLPGLPGITITQDDVLRYEDVAEWVNVGLGNDSIDGGGGIDMLSFVSMTGGMTIDMDGGTAAGGGVAHSFQNFEGVTGSIFGDFIEGDAGDNRIRALGDYDWMIGSAGADSYDGGNGRDMVSYVNNGTNVWVDLGAGSSSFGTGDDTYTSIERVTGSAFGDYMWGSDGEDDFRGLGGYDTFYGSGGGKDRYDGGNGLDTVSYLYEAFSTFTTEGVVASLLLGRGSTGNAARDLYTSIENLEGSQSDDMLTGDNDRNQLIGRNGDDTLIGNGGIDRLTGGSGSNTLDGGSGWDYAIYSADSSDYTVDTNAMTGVTTVSRNGLVSGDFDTLTNIEVLSFADGDVIL